MRRLRRKCLEFEGYAVFCWYHHRRLGKGQLTPDALVSAPMRESRNEFRLKPFIDHGPKHPLRWRHASLAAAAGITARAIAIAIGVAFPIGDALIARTTRTSSATAADAFGDHASPSTATIPTASTPISGATLVSTIARDAAQRVTDRADIPADPADGAADGGYSPKGVTKPLSSSAAIGRPLIQLSGMIQIQSKSMILNSTNILII